MIITVNVPQSWGALSKLFYKKTDQRRYLIFAGRQWRAIGDTTYFLSTVDTDLAVQRLPDFAYRVCRLYN